GTWEIRISLTSTVSPADSGVMRSRGTPQLKARAIAEGGMIKRVEGLLRAMMGIASGSRWSSCQCVERITSGRGSAGWIGVEKARSIPKMELTTLERYGSR